MLFNFCLLRLQHRPVVRRPLSLLAVVVCPPPSVVASFATSLPRIVRYRLSAQQHCRQHCHCVLLLPPLSLVACCAVHPPLLPQPTAIVDRPLRSSRFFVRRLLSFSLSPIRCLLQLSSSGTAKGGGGCCRSMRASNPFKNDGMPSLSASVRGGAMVSGVVVAPCSDVDYVVVNAAMIVTASPPFLAWRLQ